MYGLIALQGTMYFTMLSYNCLGNSGDAYWICLFVMLIWAGTETHIKTNA